MLNNWLMQTAVSWMLARMSEPSTWASIAAAGALKLHLTLNGDFSNAFVAFGVAFAALLGVVLKEGVSK